MDVRVESPDYNDYAHYLLFWREKRRHFTEPFSIKIIRTKLLPEPDRPIPQGLCLCFSTRCSKLIISEHTEHAQQRKMLRFSVNVIFILNYSPGKG